MKKIFLVLMSFVLLFSNINAINANEISTNSIEPVLHYSFDNDSLEDSQESLNGIVVGNESYKPGLKSLGQAFEISNNGFKLPSSIRLGTEDFTFSFFLKTLETKNDTLFITNKKESSGKADGFAVMNYNGLFGNAGANGERYDTSGYSRDASAVSGEWHHIVVSANRSGSLALYVDGKLSSENTDFKNIKNTSLDTGNDITIGTTMNGEYVQKSLIDEFQFYDVALTGEQALNLYNSFDTVDMDELQNIFTLIAENPISSPMGPNAEMKTQIIKQHIAKYSEKFPSLVANIDQIEGTKYAVTLTVGSKSVTEEVTFEINEKDHFTVASHNIYGWGYPNISNISKKLDSLGVDIAGLQEVNYQPNDGGQFGQFINAGHYPYGAFKGGYGTNPVWGGSTLISKYPLSNKGGENYLTNDRTNRSFVRSEVTIDGRKVALYNTHIVWLEDFDQYQEYKHAQITELLTALYMDPVEYKIVTGDFNADESTTEYDDLFAYLYGANGYNNTWYDTGELVPPMKVASIDNVFITPNMEFVDIQMADGTPSDHNIIYASIKFKDEYSQSTQLIDNAILQAEALIADASKYELDGIRALEDFIKTVKGKQLTGKDISIKTWEIRKLISNLKLDIRVTLPSAHSYFDLNEENVTDSKNNTTAVAKETLKTEEGYLGNAINTENGYLELSNLSLGNQDFTVSFWYQSLEDKNQTVLFSNKKGGSGFDKGFAIINFDGVFGNIGNGTVRVDTSSNKRDKDALNGDWHLVTVTGKRDTSLALYVDGKLSSQNTKITDLKSLNLDTEVAYMLGAGTEGGFKQNARFDELRIYKEALNADQIKALHDSDLAKKTLEQEIIRLQSIDEKIVREGYEALQTAISESQAILSEEGLVTNLVTDALNTLHESERNLLYRDLVDKVELAQVLLEARNIDQDTLVSSYVEILQNAIEKAQSVLEDSTDNQDMVDQATNELKNTLSTLSYRGNIEVLKALYDESTLLSEDKYTQETWLIFENALQKAFDTIELNDASQQDIDSVVLALTEAVEKLALESDTIPFIKINPGKSPEDNSTNETETGKTDDNTTDETGKKDDNATGETETGKKDDNTTGEVDQSKDDSTKEPTTGKTDDNSTNVIVKKDDSKAVTEKNVTSNSSSDENVDTLPATGQSDTMILVGIPMMLIGLYLLKKRKHNI